MKKQIEIDEREFDILCRMLQISNRKQVRQRANWMNIKTGESGNSCMDYQDFMFEKFGIAFTDDNFLSEKNRKILAEQLKEKTK